VSPQRELGTSIQPLKKPTANHLPVILKSNTETRLNFVEFFTIFSSAYRKVEFFTIISGLRNNLQNHRRLPECRNKHFEEGFSKDLQNQSVFS
jgi:hypothetical protein